MTEQEFRDKIAKIIENDHCIRADYSDCEGCEYKNCFSCKPYRLADALIAAGLTFDKTKAILDERTNGKTLILKAQYYDQMKHRAEVAERAVYNMAYGEWQREGARRAICEKYAPSTARDYLDRAEKELAEEEKDGNETD